MLKPLTLVTLKVYIFCLFVGVWCLHSKKNGEAALDLNDSSGSGMFVIYVLDFSFGLSQFLCVSGSDGFRSLPTSGRKTKNA
jgi:hypothetical protein